MNQQQYYANANISDPNYKGDKDYNAYYQNSS
jgi:hypothetical protein